MSNAITALGATLLFVIYVCASCIGLYLIKSASDWRSVTFLGGFFLYAAGAVLWMVILRMTQLSFAFPVAAGSLIIGSVFTGVVFLNEALSFGRILGAAIIVFGIAVIALKG